MYGNRLGWIIAGVAAVVVLGTVYLMHAATAPTPPTATIASAATSTIQLPSAPGMIAPQDQAGDAAPLLRQAIAAYQADRQSYDNIRARQTGVSGLDKYAAFGPLLQATALTQNSLFSEEDDLKALIRYDGDRPQLEALNAVGQAIIHAGLLLANAGQHDQARAHYLAGFSLGRRMFDQRVIYPEMQQGLQLMATAATGMKLLGEKTKDDALTQEATQFLNGQKTYFKEQIEPIWNTLGTIKTKQVQAHAGDVRFLAENAQDPLWRNEATLALGRYKFNDSRSADHRWAEFTLDRLSQRKNLDASQRVAVEAARGLTLPGYRSIR